MLDSQAASIDKLERKRQSSLAASLCQALLLTDGDAGPEVMAMLGSVQGKSVVELGAGIGRFTGALAATARSVTVRACQLLAAFSAGWDSGLDAQAVDFMEHLIAENKKANSHRCGLLASLAGSESASQRCLQTQGQRAVPGRRRHAAGPPARRLRCRVLQLAADVPQRRGVRQAGHRCAHLGTSLPRCVTGCRQPTRCCGVWAGSWGPPDCE